jgi:hypothetical protein
MENRLLAALPAPTLGLIYPHFSSVQLAAGAIVYEVGDEIDRIYFPNSGIASLQKVMNDGRAIDTAIVGRDGGDKAELNRYCEMIGSPMSLEGKRSSLPATRRRESW